MLYEKRLLVLGGLGTGCVRLERTAAGISAMLSVNNISGSDLLIIVRDDAGLLTFLPSTLARPYSFTLPQSCDLARITVIVADGEKLLLYGTLRSERLWTGNLEDEIKRARKILGLRPAKHSNISDFFLDIITPESYDDNRIAEVNYYKSNLAADAKDEAAATRAAQETSSPFVFPPSYPFASPPGGGTHMQPQERPDKNPPMQEKRQESGGQLTQNGSAEESRAVQNTQPRPEPLPQLRETPPPPYKKNTPPRNSNIPQWHNKPDFRAMTPDEFERECAAGNTEASHGKAQNYDAANGNNAGGYYKFEHVQPYYNPAQSQTNPENNAAQRQGWQPDNNSAQYQGWQPIHTNDGNRSGESSTERTEQYGRGYESAREPKSEPRIEPQPEPRGERRVEPQTEQKSEPRVEPQTEPRRESRIEPQPEPRGERRVEPQPEPRKEPRIEPQPEPRSERRVEPQPEPRKEPRIEPQPELKATPLPPLSNEPPDAEEALSVPPPSMMTPPVLESAAFYETVKAQLDKLFSKNEHYGALERMLPDSKWVRVDYDNKGKFYLIGLVGEPVRYICYGVPGKYSPRPPAELAGYCQWLAVDEDDPIGEGFWVMYQDAISGKSVL